MHHDLGENGEGSRDTEDWITDSTSKIFLNSGFDKQKFPGFRNSGEKEGLLGLQLLPLL